MKKGTFQKAVQVKPMEGKKDSSKPVGPGKVMAPYTPAGRKGKSVKKK